MSSGLTGSELFGRAWRIIVEDEKGEKALDVSELECTFQVNKSYDSGGFTGIVKIYNLNADTESAIIMEGYRLIIEAGYSSYELVGDVGTGNSPTINTGTSSSSGNEIKTSQSNESVVISGVSGSTNTSNTESGAIKGQTTAKPTQYGKIFDGQITWPSRQRDGVNYILTLAAIDGDEPLHKGFISKTVNRGLNARGIIEAAAKNNEKKTLLGTISDGLSEQRLPRGKVFFGNPIGFIRDAARGNDADVYIEDGSLNVVRIPDKTPEEAIVITPESGLIGTPTQTQDGIEFTILLNPNITIRSLIKLSGITTINEVENGTGNEKQSALDDEFMYQVIGLTHSGDTRGNEWYTHIKGISRHGKGALAAMLANADQRGQGV